MSRRGPVLLAGWTERPGPAGSTPGPPCCGRSSLPGLWPADRMDARGAGISGSPDRQTLAKQGGVFLLPYAGVSAEPFSCGHLGNQHRPADSWLLKGPAGTAAALQAALRLQCMLSNTNRRCKRRYVCIYTDTYIYMIFMTLTCQFFDIS